MESLTRRSLRACWLAAASVVASLPVIAGAAPDIGLQMSLDTLVPTPGQTVQFTVVASNVGTTTATGVQVTDTLAAELRIPTGMAAFPSTGTFDAATGVWSVGSLDPGTSATLVIPAVVAAASQPPCSVNSAQASVASDANPANDRAVAAVKRSLTDRCVDLAVESSSWSVDGCDSWYELELHVTVSNAGPDAASTVYVDMTQTPDFLPHLRFVSDGCSGTRCTIESLPAGASLKLKAVTDPIDINKNKSVLFGFTTSSADTDYATSNNQREYSTLVPRTPDCYYGDDGYGGVWFSGCFIATAAYGSPLEAHVQVLREFRDHYLQRTAVGRAFIRFYYRHSPPVAAVIARHEWLRLLVRCLLGPLVLAIEFPGRALLTTLCAGALFAGWRRRRARGQVPAG
jgi:uncharacterized repeat protein (TIGR01451 family)